ncbi:MAG: hypothetical protein GXP13_01445 [Gammaproteobacteria bacterium]|nr:hypothetical protein [Gammaproteobacteria bacterium]
MSIANILQSDQLNNNELTKLIENGTELLKLSIVQGMNSRMNPKTYRFKPVTMAIKKRSEQQVSSVAMVISEYFNTLSPEKLNTIKRSLGRDKLITSAIRARGLNMRSSKSIIEQTNLQSLFSSINEKTFSETAVKSMIADISVLADRDATPVRDVILNDLKSLDIRYGRLLPARWWQPLIPAISAPDWELDPGRPNPPERTPNRNVRFRIHKVKCVDETNPEWGGDDEISWGGVTLDDKGHISKVPEKKVMNGFSDNESKDYNPPTIIKDFPLNSDYPKEFLVTMSLAEKDSGGLSDFIQKLYEAVEGEIIDILTKLAGAAVGATIGGSIGSLAGPLGTIIGVIAGAILGKLVEWLSGFLKDDIFKPQASSLFLETANDTFPGGGLISPKQKLHYKDFGGHYTITYDWEIT